MWLAPTLGGGRNELNLKWGRSTIKLYMFLVICSFFLLFVFVVVDQGCCVVYFGRVRLSRHL